MDFDNGMSRCDRSQPDDTNTTDTTQTDQAELWDQFMAQTQPSVMSNEPYIPFPADFSNSGHGGVQEADPFPLEYMSYQAMVSSTGSQSSYGSHGICGGLSHPAYNTGATGSSGQSLAAVSYVQS